MDTELKLKFWRHGQIDSERLAGQLLHLEGFASLDPQCPLGGPDGLKDLLCEKNGWYYIGAAYFPSSDKTFSDVKDKYVHDLEGVGKNNAGGLVFITNQSLTPSERDELTRIATQEGLKVIIYHLERIRLILDSPAGYGIRLEFLDIDMTREEQLSFFSVWDRSFTDRLNQHGAMIVKELSKKIDSIRESTENYKDTVNQFVQSTQRIVNYIFDDIGIDDNTKLDVANFEDRLMTPSSLCIIHSALLFDDPVFVHAGHFRDVDVWIGPSGVGPEAASYTPPPPEQVRPLIESLLKNWRESVMELSNSRSPQKVIKQVARFYYNFLRIHPFTDGNGRVAKYLLNQQLWNLLGCSRKVVIENSFSYHNVLAMAEGGDLAPLEAMITQAVYGSDVVPDDI